MKIRHLVLAMALAVAGASGIAQTSTPAPVSGASAPVAAKPGQRILTPAEMRDRATPSDDLPPQGQVTPQLSFPLGKKTEPSSPLVRPARPASPASPAAAASASGVGDAVARCEAQASEEARASCRAKLAHEAPIRK